MMMMMTDADEHEVDSEENDDSMMHDNDVTIDSKVLQGKQYPMTVYKLDSVCNDSHSKFVLHLKLQTVVYVFLTVYWKLPIPGAAVPLLSGLD